MIVYRSEIWPEIADRSGLVTLPFAATTDAGMQECSERMTRASPP